MQRAIEIRKLQKIGKFPTQSIGTCGVVFQGDSGTGKSVMIEAVLQERGITEKKSLREIEWEMNSEIQPETQPHYYYKIPASLPIEEIEKNLIKAFELGVIVVFDEMNTRIKEGGIEKTINALLTGEHPSNPKIKPKAGFMIISSINSASNSGRSALSPAILHRSTVINAKSLSKYQAEDFKKIIENWTKDNREKINEETLIKASETFAELAKTKPETINNLRELKKLMPNILKNLKSQNQEIIQR